MISKSKIVRNIVGLSIVLAIAVMAMMQPAAADQTAFRGLVNFTHNDTLVPEGWNVSVENLNQAYAGEPWKTTTDDSLLPVRANYNLAVQFASGTDLVRAYVHSPDYVWTGVNTTLPGLQNMTEYLGARYMNIKVSRAPFVNVIYPNGSENISVGSTITVNASVDDDIGVTGVNFSYSPDNGANWYDIGSGQLEPGGNMSIGMWNVTWDTSVLNNGTGTNYRIMVNATDNSTVGYATDTSDAVFSLIDDTKPLLCNATATPAAIVVNLTNTTLWVDVTDKWSNISGDVIVNLTPIGGPGNVIMEHYAYKEYVNLNWSVKFRADVNVTSDQYIGNHCLQVNVSDSFGNYNDSVCIQLKVIKGVQPTNLTAILNANDTVTIKCNGTEGADYDIYITENYTAGFQGTPNATATGLAGDIVMWTDKNASNYSQRYYKVALTGMPPTNETVGKFNISAYTDWNLVSTPLLLDDTSLSAVIRDAGVGDNIFDYDNVDGIRTSVYVGLWSGPVQTFEPEKGYWYQNVGAADFDITVVGDVPTGNITTMLYLDWNLVGYTSVNTSSVNIVTGAGVGDNIFDYDNVDGIRTSVYVGLWSGPVQTFEPGKGYWYQSVVADVTWEYVA